MTVTIDPAVSARRECAGYAQGFAEGAFGHKSDGWNSRDSKRQNTKVIAGTLFEFEFVSPRGKFAVIRIEGVLRLDQSNQSLVEIPVTVKVFVSNLAIHGYHGVVDAERSLGQKFYVDIECELEPVEALTDDMSATVCYGDLCTLAQDVSCRSTFNLIEVLARNIIDEIFCTYPLVRHVALRVRKPSAPIRHFVDYVGVEVSQARH